MKKPKELEFSFQCEFTPITPLEEKNFWRVINEIAQRALEIGQEKSVEVKEKEE